MLRAVPITLAIILCFSNLGFIDLGMNAPDTAQTPRNHLTQDKNAQAAAIEPLDPDATPVYSVDGFIQREGQILRLRWDVVPNAVKYEIFIDGESLFAFTNGIEIPVDDVHKRFQVNAISFEGETIQSKISVRDLDVNPTSPRTTTEFDKMAYPPIYPVYSWIPVNGADHYAIELIKDGKIIRRYFTPSQSLEDNFDFYDKVAVLDEGKYYWRVRALTADNQSLTAWSEPDESNSFEVKHNIRFCALGDSITHGGGSISAPPSTVVYNWETYCAIPVKNLGRSGDTTAELLARFDSDVLPFRPEVLFIMAGVNDYRAKIFGWESVENLKAIKAKCERNGIKAVFLTPTPLNPAQIDKISFVDPPPADWQEHQKFICKWIREQGDYIDVNAQLTDDEGNLIDALSVDGLHPDDVGKRIIGEAVAAWLDNYLNLN